MSDLFEKARSLYGYATEYNANDHVPIHIHDIRAHNLEEFDRMIQEVKADAWDEGAEALEHHQMHVSGGWPTNPYRKQEEA